MREFLQMLPGAVKYLFGRVRGSFFDSNGVQIHYTDEGAGEPVVLVHGYAVDADSNWRIRGITQALAKEYRVIALDNRGHGLSGKPHDAGQYGVEMVKDVVRLLDHLKIEKAHVVGYSMGGYMTLKLITMFPERLLSAVPCAAGWELPTSDNVAKLEAVADSLDNGKGFWPLLVAINAIGHKPNRLLLAVPDALMTHYNDIKAMACIMRRFADLVVTEEELRRNTVPVLSIVGAIDPLRSGVDNMIGVMANHEAFFVEGRDHMTTLYTPRYLEVLRTFLKKHAMAQA